MNDILVRLYSILAIRLDVPLSDIDENSSLAADLGADSLDLVEIAMECENEFGVIMAMGVEDSLSTVGEWAAEIERLMK